MYLKAYGKINLSLDITGVREDGYHTLRSVFLPIDYYDDVYIDKALEDSFNCNQPFLKFNESNTVYKALELMRKEFNIEDKFAITVNKMIPTQAGLAGGSGDAAAIIRFFNMEYKLNLSDEKIRELCMKIGADVLFTYYSTPALVEGIGEIITPIKMKKSYYCLIAKPRMGVSTKKCYELMDVNNCVHPDIDKIVKALEHGEDFIPYLGNSMEEAAISLVGDIQNIKDIMMENGATFALMSGSGSSVFTLSENEHLIKRIAYRIKSAGYMSRYTKILKR